MNFRDTIEQLNKLYEATEINEEVDTLDGSRYFTGFGSADDRSDFWKYAKEGQISLGDFNDGFINDNEKLEKMLEEAGVNFDELFTKITGARWYDPTHTETYYTLNGKQSYGAIKKLAEKFPDEWYVKALKKLWAMLYVDNVKPKELQAADYMTFKKTVLQILATSPKSDDLLKLGAEEQIKRYNNDKSVNPQIGYFVYFSDNKDSIKFEHTWRTDSYDDYADLNWHTSEEHIQIRTIKVEDGANKTAEEFAEIVLAKNAAKDYEERHR